MTCFSRNCLLFRSTCVQSHFQWGSCYFSFMCNVLQIVVCHFVLFLLAIVLSVLHFTDSDYPFCIFKLFILDILLFIQFLNDLFMITTRVNLRQEQVTLSELFCYVQPLRFVILSNTLKKNKLDSQSFEFERTNEGCSSFVLTKLDIYVYTALQVSNQ